MYIYLDIFPAEKSIGFELEDLHTSFRKDGGESLYQFENVR